ncbi:FAD-binding domain-containing protein [Kalaharituber pfeilii]|nr:FAD-binding domain-containing protein [Kalaharituber pfeilii]
MSHHSSHGGSKVLTNPELAQVYWLFAGGAIVVASLVNVADKLLYWQRLRAASNSDPTPAKPKNILLKTWATVTAISREISWAAPPTLLPNYPQLNLPPLGRILIIAANVCLLLAIAFWGFDLNHRRLWEDIAIRAAWITVTQIPLVFLMAGKRNIVGFLTGSSYERLNWIHRWVARCLFTTATIHMSYFFKVWGKYNSIDDMLKEDIISKRGLGAWCILAWITFSSFAPIRNIGYEFFVLQHIVSYVAFITMVMLHTPVQAHNFLWVPIGIYLADRTIRTLYIIYNNLSIFHPSKRNASPMSKSIFTCKATFTALPDHATLVTIPNPPFSWSPGQHVFFSCHSLVPLQSHPFTIASLPSDKSLNFIIRAHRGGTNRIFRHANKSLPPLPDKTVIIDGPYGRVRPLEQFDTVLLIAGSTGATFTIPLLRDLVCLWQLEISGSGKGLVTRKVKFVWVIKNRNQICWFAKELKNCFEVLGGAGDKKEEEGKLVMEASVYITCDEMLTVDHKLLELESSSSSSNAEGRNNPEMSGNKPTSDSETDIDNTTEQTGKLCGGDRCCCIDTVLEDDAISPDISTPHGCNCGMPFPPVPADLAPPPDSTPTRTSAALNSVKSNRGNPARSLTVPVINNNWMSAAPPTLQQSLALPEKTHIMTGRPAIRVVINKELEQARGRRQ